MPTYNVFFPQVVDAIVEADSADEARTQFAAKLGVSTTYIFAVLKPDPKPEPLATSHAGQHSDGNGPFEVFWHDGRQPTGDSPGGEPGWYWWSCSPGCLPDGEAQGPYLTSSEAYEHYHGQGSWDCHNCAPTEQCPRSGTCPVRQ